MEFGSETFGVMAQVLAVLLLATAFAPELRGSLSKEWITDTDGRRHLVPTRRHRSMGNIGRDRYRMSIFILVIITFDAIIMMSGFTFRDGWTMIPLLLNSAALGGLVGMVLTSIRSHVDEEPGDRSDGPEHR